MTQIDLINKAQTIKKAGAKVEIVGKWVWAEFDTKPSVEVREAMKHEGFHWNPKREVWQFAGPPCRHSPAMTEEIKAKYGVQTLEDATV